MADLATLNLDAFSDGQVASKLWLCQELEAYISRQNLCPSVWILGGWYGTLSFLLLSREKVALKGIRSFDIDPQACALADKVNLHWRLQNHSFQAHQMDCNHLHYTGGNYGAGPDIVINTSCEHFAEMQWWAQIPPGTFVVLQSTDMKHVEHCRTMRSLQEMRSTYKLASEEYAGEKKFKYPGFQFSRFMLMGAKL